MSSSDEANLIRNGLHDLAQRAPRFGVRATFVMLSFLGFLNVYAMRVNLSVAIVAMVNQTALKPATNGSSPDPMNGTCPEPDYPNGTQPSPATSDGPFDWDETTQGYILGSFFYGYVVTQIPGGIVAELYGGKWLFGVGILITSVFTLLTPLAAHLNVYALIAVRVMEGLGEGVTFPVMHFMLSQWAPPLERTRMCTITYAGSMMGTIISMPASGLLCDYLGWEYVFYVFGALGVIWFFFWAFLAFDSPNEHPYISQEEKDYIQISQGRRRLDDQTSGSEEETRARRPPIPWAQIVCSAPIWSILVAHCCCNWGFYTLLTELPTYLRQILHFNIKKNAVLSAVPYMVQWCLAVSGSYLADWILEKQLLSRNATRKLFNSLGFFVPAISLLCLSLAGCQWEIVLALLCITVGFSGFSNSGFNVNHIDVAPNYSGTLMGITNTAANFTGFLAPMAVSYIINGQENLSSWQVVFYISALVYVVGNLQYLIFGSSEEVEWNKPQQTRSGQQPDPQGAASPVPRLEASSDVSIQ